jgi:hypothetical protein
MRRRYLATTPSLARRSNAAEDEEDEREREEEEEEEDFEINNLSESFYSKKNATEYIGSNPIRLRRLIGTANEDETTRIDRARVTNELNERALKRSKGEETQDDILCGAILMLGASSKAFARVDESSLRRFHSTPSSVGETKAKNLQEDADADERREKKKHRQNQGVRTDLVRRKNDANKKNARMKTNYTITINEDTKEHDYAINDRKVKELHICLTCGKASVTPSALRIHINTHLGQKPYECDKCGKTFTQASNLKKHTLVHTGQSQYMCEYCGKACASKRNLNEHMVVHTGKSDFVCKLCNRACASQSHMNAHMRTHTGEKPFICRVPNCNKRFTQPSQLRVHVRLHAGEILDAYECDECDKKFSSEIQLKKHLTSIDAHTKRPKTKQKNIKKVPPLTFAQKQELILSMATAALPRAL